MAELHPRAKALLADASALSPIHTLTIEEARERSRAALVQVGRQRLTLVEDISIETGTAALSARLYRPLRGAALPILVFFHGGGWILNDLDTHDALCDTLAHAAQCVVLSVDYRRSPEHRYPAAIHDARSALDWAAANAALIDGDASRIAVGGDSAGGTIAAALAKVARDEKGPQVRAQLLFYPVLDYSVPGTTSYAEYGVGYTVDHDFMRWIWAAYLPAEWEREDPYLFPLQGELAGLPTTIIYTAEHDVLRDEGAAYAEKLRNAGVSVEFMNADDQMHGFANHTESIDRAAELVREAGYALKRAMGRV